MKTDERILVLTSTRKDALSTEKILADAGLQPVICSTMSELVQEIDKGVGALLIAKEILISGDLNSLKSTLDNQPSWSEVQTVILASSGDLAQAKIVDILKTLRNTTILERPVRVATLVSVLESAVANRKRQYEVRRLLRQLQTAMEESDRANKTKSEFLANMSHEIRTPLGAVLGFAELALEGNLNPGERDMYASTIKRNGQLVLALINDILDLSKIEAGRIEIENIEIRVREILCDVVSMLKPQAEHKGIDVKVEIDDSVPAIILGDPVRIRQIISNLAGNALKFTPKGSVTLRLWSEEKDAGRCHLFLEVEDTGIGIAKSQQERLFQAFSQADSSTTRSFGGTGLGLFLSQQLARTLGGDLKLVKSIPGEGSTFRFDLEVQTVQIENQEPLVSEIPPENKVEIKKMKILLVEDSPDNQVLISRVLRNAGAHVDTANDGMEGVEKALHDSFDVVLMDIQMPKLDGNQATAQLRREGYKKPIIALTAHALKGERERAITSGFDDYLTKPVRKLDLIETLNRFCS